MTQFAARQAPARNGTRRDGQCGVATHVHFDRTQLPHHACHVCGGQRAQQMFNLQPTDTRPQSRNLILRSRAAGWNDNDIAPMDLERTVEAHRRLIVIVCEVTGCEDEETPVPAASLIHASFGILQVPWSLRGARTASSFEARVHVWRLAQLQHAASRRSVCAA